MDLVVENLRRFAGRHRLPTRPITLVVGENSSGKTSLLAAFVAALSQTNAPIPFSFNIPPFELGSYSTIATYKGGKYGRAADFLVALERTDENGVSTRWSVSFADREGLPAPFRIETETASGSMSLQVGDDGATTVELKTKEHGTVSLSIPVLRAREGLPLLNVLMRHAIRDGSRPTKLTRIPVGTLRTLAAPFYLTEPPIALAPIRTKPKRTYDQLSDTPTPEGDHVPLLLSRALGPREASPTRDRLAAAIKAFGAESGLFREVRPRSLGRDPGDPFQIMVTTTGRPANLVDVGYGVSQALPLAVQCILAERGRQLVIQQPEVHLHPRAQAALGSLLVQLHTNEHKRFLVETHSDYLVDRIRRHVAQGDIPAGDVSLVFVEMCGLESAIHPLELDRAGNILNAPPSYREFFLQEQLSLFSR